MSRSRIEFDPLAVLPAIKDYRTNGAAPARLSTTEEQREQAVDHALAWMVEHKVWVVDVLVRWTRTDPTVLSVKGHAEHLVIPGKPERIVPDWDEVTEAALDGTPIVRTPSEEQTMLEAELAEIYDDGLA